KEKYERLMSRLRGRSGGDEGSTASARLASLLKPDGQSGRRDLIAGALRAARALHAPGAETVASSFASDPDPLIASAARGEPPPAPIQKASPSAPLDVRTALWSDDGNVRAEACAAAAASADPAVALARKALARADPERRVRAACSAPNETAPGK